MSSVVLLKLLAIFAVIGIGWGAGRAKLVGPDAAGVLTQLAFVLFAPALLFRTTAAVSVTALPWSMLAAYFVPTLGMLLGGYLWQRLRRPPPNPAAAVRGLSLSFSNTVQLGIPVVTALFGPAGLTIHIAIISLQALVLLTTATVLAETDLARDARHSPARMVAQTVRRSLIHPVVLPILLGLAYNATGWPIPGPVDDVLATLGQAVVPVSLVAIGLTLHLYGFTSAAPQALRLTVGKLVLHPGVVLAVAYLGFGLRGLPLVIAVLCAGLPIGSNVLLFAARYDTLQGETTAAIVASTSGFLVTGTIWLFILSYLT